MNFDTLRTRLVEAEEAVDQFLMERDDALFRSEFGPLFDRAAATSDVMRLNRNIYSVENEIRDIRVLLASNS